MGRLIEADEVNDAIYKSFEDIQCYNGTGYDIYSDSKEIIDKIKTVEAIPKADYEARLKADMVAMLTELQNEMQKYSGCSCTCSDGVVNDIDDLIQEKINKLKGE